MKRPFQQVDAFTATRYVGNPVAVVLEADGLSTEEMARVARTNLSETTFVLPPTTDGADYRVRIFTPGTELPFAGHPTLARAMRGCARAMCNTIPSTSFRSAPPG